MKDENEIIIIEKYGYNAKRDTICFTGKTIANYLANCKMY